MARPQVTVVSRDLLTVSRLIDAADRAGVDLTRVDDPALLPAAADLALVLVDWGDRQRDWASALARWRATASGQTLPRVVLFGPHSDLEAHADARRAGLGPMWARSRLFASLSTLFAGSPVVGDAPPIREGDRNER